MIKHLIFEMDGVLADSAKAIIPACTHTSQKFELPPVSDEAVREIIGWPSPEFYFRLYPHKSKRMMLEYARDADALVEAIVWDMGKRILFPGVLFMLESLMQRRVGLCVMSAAHFSYVNAVLTTAGIQHFFDVIAFGSDGGQATVRNMVYSDRSRWALVGSSRESLSAAKANGIFTMAAGFGYAGRQNADLSDHTVRTPGNVLGRV